MNRGNLNLMLASLVMAASCLSALAFAPSGKGYNVKIFSDGKLFTSMSLIPQPPGRAMYSFSIFRVPGGKKAQTPEGEKVYAFQILPTLEKDSVKIEVLALLEDPDTVSEAHPLHKFKKQAVATYSARAGESLTIAEMSQFGVQPLEIKVVSRS